MRVVITFERLAGPPRLSLTCPDYPSFVAAWLPAVHEALAAAGHETWSPAAVIAQGFLMPSSPVRRRKGYTKLFLADSDLVGAPLSLEDGSMAPRDGVQLLYALATGPEAAHDRMARLGLGDAAAMLVYTRSPQTNATMRAALEKALRTSDDDAVGWDHGALLDALPGALCVAGPIIDPIGVLSIGVAADAPASQALLDGWGP
jgi:hypothetical protein